MAKRNQSRSIEIWNLVKDRGPATLAQIKSELCLTRGEVGSALTRMVNCGSLIKREGYNPDSGGRFSRVKVFIYERGNAEPKAPGRHERSVDDAAEAARRTKIHRAKKFLEEQGYKVTSPDPGS